MSDLQLHTFINGNKTTTLVNEKTIDALELQRFFIVYHSVRDHYFMPSFHTGTLGVLEEGVTFEDVSFEYNNCRTNVERVNFVCDLIGKPHIF